MSLDVNSVSIDPITKYPIVRVWKLIIVINVHIITLKMVGGPGRTRTDSAFATD